MLLSLAFICHGHERSYSPEQKKVTHIIISIGAQLRTYIQVILDFSIFLTGKWSCEMKIVPPPPPASNHNDGQTALLDNIQPAACFNSGLYGARNVETSSQVVYHHC